MMPYRVLKILSFLILSHDFSVFVAALIVSTWLCKQMDESFPTWQYTFSI